MDPSDYFDPTLENFKSNYHLSINSETVKNLPLVENLDVDQRLKAQLSFLREWLICLISNDETKYSKYNPASSMNFFRSNPKTV